MGTDLIRPCSGCVSEIPYLVKLLNCSTKILLDFKFGVNLYNFSQNNLSLVGNHQIKPMQLTYFNYK